MTEGPLSGMSGPPLRELKGYGTFLYDLCFIVIGFGRGKGWSQHSQSGVILTLGEMSGLIRKPYERCYTKAHDAK